MKNKSIGFIFSIAAIAIALNLFGILAVLTNGIGQVENATEKTTLTESAVKEALRVKFAVSQIQQFLTDASLTGEKDALKEAEESAAEFKKSIELLEKRLPESKSQLNSQLADGIQLYNVGMEMYKAYTEKGKTAGDLIMKRKDTGLDDLSDSLGKKMEKFATEIENSNSITHAEFNSAIKQMRFLSIAVVFFALLITSVMLLLLFARVKKINLVTETLIETVQEVRGSVGVMFGIAQSLTSATSKQTAGLSETAAAIDEISAMALKSSEGAAQSERASHQSRDAAERGKEAVTQMLTSMSEIHKKNEEVVNTVNAGNEKFKEIVRVIQEIGAKTKVINDIVFQTKLLSFNASVEAARAGEQGKGFAVVAEEVGNLAQMSGTAAQEISSMLEGSISKVDAIVNETRSSVEAKVASAKSTVNRGIEVARECEKVLAEIVASSEEVTQSVASIATASQEQTTGVTEISNALHQISHNAQVTQGVSGDCAEAAELLAGKTQVLQQASGNLRLAVEGKVSVAKFNLSKDFMLGVAAMDSEHQVLVDKMNHLAEVLETAGVTSKSPELKASFTSLAEFTVKHFSNEERYMQTIHYPDFSVHKAIHEKLLQQVTNFNEKLGTGSFDGLELMAFLNDWLMRHILGLDKKYAAYSKSERS